MESSKEKGQGKFSERQIELLQGESDPRDKDEWEWLQKNANAIIPGEDSPSDKSGNKESRMPSIDELAPPGVEGDLERADPRLVEAWQNATSPEDATEERMREVRGKNDD